VLFLSCRKTATYFSDVRACRKEVTGFRSGWDRNSDWFVIAVLCSIARCGSEVVEKKISRICHDYWFIHHFKAFTDHMRQGYSWKFSPGINWRY